MDCPRAHDTKAQKSIKSENDVENLQKDLETM